VECAEGGSEGYYQDQERNNCDTSMKREYFGKNHNLYILNQLIYISDKFIILDKTSCIETQ